MRSSPPPSNWPPMPGIGAALASVACVIAAALGLHLGRESLPEMTVPLGLVLAVLASAVTFGFWAGLLAAVAGFAALNFLFTEPLFTFVVGAPQDLVALFVFLLVAGLAGLMAGRLHDRAEAARVRAETLETLAALSSDLAAAESAEAARATALRHLAALSGGAAVAFGPDVPPPDLSAADLQAAERALRLGRAEPAPLPGWPGASLSFLPVAPGLVLGHGRLLGREGPGRALAVAALAEQLGLALQRLDYAAAARAEGLRAETEAMRAALLTSLSHDLRTPLATILGAASSLRELDAALEPAARADLVQAIEEEALRLNRHVTNLLQMTRLERAPEPRLAWVDPGDIARAAVARARRSWPGARIEARIAADLPMLRAEAGLVEQALFNLIDNGLHHGGGAVRIGAELGPGLTLTVADDGPGPSPAIRDWLAGSDPRPAAGQRGLGLAVARGIARLHGGTLTWEAGAFRFTLPCEAQHG